MARVTVGRGNSKVTITGPDARELEDLVRDALGPIGDVLKPPLEALAKEVRETWPVAGKNSKGSAKSWDYEITLLPDTWTVSYGLTNPNAWVRAVESAKIGTKRAFREARDVLDDDVEPKARALQEGIKTAIKETLDAHLTGGR